MHKLYEKSEIWFSVAWILVYVIGTSIAEQLSGMLGIEKSFAMIFHLVMCAVALMWMKKHGLFRKYGICRTDVPAKRFLYYIPLAAIISCNLWFGVTVNLPIYEIIFYIVSMICVGFLEEFIFRGLLFKAMSRDGLKSAIIVSSITFGIGHIINLFNGSGASLVSNLCQIGYAIAFGFLFVIIFHRGGSLIPCIVTHSAINALSVFAKDIPSAKAEIISSLVLAALALGYTVVLLKTLSSGEK